MEKAHPIYIDQRVHDLRVHALRRRSRCKEGGDSWYAWDRVVEECTDDQPLHEIEDILRYLSYMLPTPRRQRDIFSKLAKEIKEGAWG